MIKQIFFLFLWSSLALYCFSAATTEPPKECAVGTSDYNETLCSETCTKDVHANQSYCSNFTQSTATTQSQPKQQEIHNPVTTPEVTLPQEAMRNNDLSAPEFDINDRSSGMSLRSSSVFSVTCIVLSIIL